MQAVVARARERLGANGQRTILFLDEIHRFNKAQQDALLPVVESGLVTLDRRDDREPLPRRDRRAPLALPAVRVPAARRPVRSSACSSAARSVARRRRCPTTAARGALLAAAGGDARSLLVALEVAHEHALSRRASPTRGRRTWPRPSSAGPSCYDKRGDRHYDTISAFIKSVRGSDPDAALYYLASMLEGGEDLLFIVPPARDPRERGHRQRRSRTRSRWPSPAPQAVQMIGLPEGRIALGADDRLPGARAEVERELRRDRTRRSRRCASAATRDRPRPLRDASYRGAERARARASATAIRTTIPTATSRRSTCPTDLVGTRFYEPTDHGPRRRCGAARRAAPRRRRAVASPAGSTKPEAVLACQHPLGLCTSVGGFQRGRREWSEAERTPLPQHPRASLPNPRQR